MNADQVKNAAKEIELELGYMFKDDPEDCLLCVRLSDQKINPTDAELVRHIFWMINHIPFHIKNGNLDKAMRWLGFIQGCIVARGWGTIAGEKSRNKPKEDDARN